MELRQRLSQHFATGPRIAPGVFIADTARVTGDVTLGEGASVFYGAVLRGDINRIEVGAGSNVQDNAVIHVSDDLPAIIGAEVSIGHLAVVHACTVEDGVLIGMQATILDGARIESEAMVAAGALVPQGMVVPTGMLAVGLPARIVRALTPEERQAQRNLAVKYQEVARQHQARK